MRGRAALGTRNVRSISVSRTLQTSRKLEKAQKTLVLNVLGNFTGLTETLK